MSEFNLLEALESLSDDEELEVVEQSGEEQKKSVAIYVRTSTKRQQTSIQNQQSVADLYIKNRNKVVKDAKTEEKEIKEDIKDDVIVYKTYIDTYSGKSQQGRVALDNLMSDAERGCFQTVYTKSISRFCRNLEDGLRLTRELKDLGVNVYFQEENIDSSDASSDFIFVILAKVAEQELNNTSSHLRQVTEAKRQNNEIVNPIQCFGYGWITKLENPKLKAEERAYVIEEQANVVKRVYHMFLNLGMSISEIERKLKADKVKTMSGDNEWTYKKVRNILINEKYTGFSYKQKYFSKDYKSKRVELDILTKKNKKYGFDKKIEFFTNEDGTPKKTQPRIIEDKDYFLSIRKLLKIANANVKPEKIYHTFTGKILCGACGYYYTRGGGYVREYKDKRKYEIKPHWLCKSYRKKGNNTLSSVKDNHIGCPDSISLREDYIQELFIKIMQDLTEYKNKIVIKAQIENFKSILYKQSKDDDELSSLILTAENNISLNDYLILKIEDALEFNSEDLEVMDSLGYSQSFITEFKTMLRTVARQTTRLINVDNIDVEVAKRDNVRNKLYSRFLKGFYDMKENLFIQCDIYKANKYDDICIRENISALEEIYNLKNEDIKNEWNDTYASLFRRVVDYIQAGEYVFYDRGNSKDVSVVFEPNNIIFKLKWNTNNEYRFNPSGRPHEKEFCSDSESRVWRRENRTGNGKH